MNSSAAEEVVNAWLCNNVAELEIVVGDAEGKLEPNS